MANQETASSNATGCSQASRIIDAWEVWPHHDPSYDYYLTDDAREIEGYVQMVTESWLDAHPETNEELVIRIKVKEMTQHDYEEATTSEP